MKAHLSTRVTALIAAACGAFVTYTLCVPGCQKHRSWTGASTQVQTNHPGQRRLLSILDESLWVTPCSSRWAVPSLPGSGEQVFLSRMSEHVDQSGGFRVYREGGYWYYLRADLLLAAQGEHPGYMTGDNQLPLNESGMSYAESPDAGRYVLAKMTSGEYAKRAPRPPVEIYDLTVSFREPVATWRWPFDDTSDTMYPVVVWSTPDSVWISGQGRAYLVDLRSGTTDRSFTIGGRYRLSTDDGSLPSVCSLPHENGIIQTTVSRKYTRLEVSFTSLKDGVTTEYGGVESVVPVVACGQTTGEHLVGLVIYETGRYVLFRARPFAVMADGLLPSEGCYMSSQVTFSPDGAHVAFSLQLSQRRYSPKTPGGYDSLLVVADVTGVRDNMVPKVVVPCNTTGGAQFCWSRDGGRIFFLERGTQVLCVDVP